MISGRTVEIQQLDAIMASPQAELLAIYGRRRIGKTYLIHHYFHERGIYFELSGVKGATLKEQLRNFSVELGDVFYQGKPQTVPTSWQDAFLQLKQAVEFSNRFTGKIILFFDELPWLAGPRSRCLSAFEYCWNRYLSRDPRMIVIICGSAAAWMIHKIIHNKAGLHGRVTREIRLLPFNLEEVENFLKDRNIVLDRKQLIELYMVIGGVAKYWTYVEPGQSTTQIVNALCFSPQGPLWKEFNKLYASLFEHAEHHLSLIKALAQNKTGFMHEDLLSKAGLRSGGSASKVINELLESGFIAYVPTFGKHKFKGLYRLIDEYSLFFLSWIAKAPQFANQLNDPDYWFKQHNTQAFATWSGYAFETFCLKHILPIKRALGISGILTTESCWSMHGAQIDLIMDRADHCINLCEIKYYNQPVVLTEADAEHLNRKRQMFLQKTNTRKTLFNTFITPYGVQKNKHYLTCVDKQLTLHEIFSGS